MGGCSSSPSLKTLTYETCHAYRPNFTIAKCVRVYDGDTIHLGVHDRDQQVRYSCRLAGIDTPELRTKDEVERAHAIQSRDRMKQLVEHQIVRVEIQGLDKYGRVLAKVYPPHSQEDVSTIMLRENLAVPYEGGTKAAFIVP